VPFPYRSYLPNFVRDVDEIGDEAEANRIKLRSTSGSGGLGGNHRIDDWTICNSNWIEFLEAAAQAIARLSCCVLCVCLCLEVRLISNKDSY
jgi:hypothetical protein